jgi:hypothetical protein
VSAKRLVPLSGIVTVAAIFASFAIVGDTPDTDAPINEVVSFYTKHDSDAQFSGALSALAALMFLIFSSTVAGVLRRAEGDPGGASALAYGGGILFATGGAIFAGVSFTIGDTVKDIDPASLQTLHVLSEDLFFPVAVGTVAFLLGAGIGVVKTGVLPKWLGWAAIVVALVGITPIGFVSFPALGLWTLVVSVMLFMRADTA